MKINVKVILVLVGVVFIGALVLRKKRSSLETFKPENKVAESAPAAPSPEILTPEQVQALPRSQGNIQTIVQRDKMEKAVGFKQMPLTVEGGEAKLKVVLSVKPVCHPGDADAFIQDLKAEPSHKILASLEELTGKERKISWEIPKTIFKDGKAEKVFQIPVGPDPVQYGFFICTAKSRDTFCGDKPLKDVNEIFTEHMNKQPNAGKEPRNIFFQYFLVDDRGISGLTHIPKGPGNPIFDNLKKYVQDSKIESKPNHEEIELVKKGLKANSSLPAVFDNGTLTLVLPKFKESACLPGPN